MPKYLGLERLYPQAHSPLFPPSLSDPYVSWRVVSMSLLISYLSAESFFVCEAEAQPMNSLSSGQWTESLSQYADRVNEAPTPPPEYLRRRWRWEEHQELQEERGKTPAGSPPLFPVDEEASLLYRLQESLWSRLGQANKSPLYESPHVRNQRSAQMDLETRGTPILPTYTHEFIPAVYPHKRMTSWNVISSEGHLEVEIGGLTEIESISLPQAESCIEGKSSTLPTLDRYLSMGEGIWIKPDQLDLSCLRDECLRRGASCFLGVFSTEQWVHYTQPRGVASVSPEQSLITLNTQSAVIMSQDDAGNFYLSASPDTGLSRLEKLAVVVSAPRSYFSGAWRSSLPLSALEQSPYLQLPTAIKRQAIFLSSQLLDLTPERPFESMIFRLADYFRSFVPGDSQPLNETVYQTLMLSQIGVCRHRSYAFMVTARALGIPTRYVTNQVHAFVEILDPSGRWRRVDLGGEGIAPEDTRLTEAVKPQDRHDQDDLYRPDDGLPRPAPYQHSTEGSSAIRDVLKSSNREWPSESATRSKTSEDERVTGLIHQEAGSDDQETHGGSGASEGQSKSPGEWGTEDELLPEEVTTDRLKSLKEERREEPTSMTDTRETQPSAIAGEVSTRLNDEAAAELLPSSFLSKVPCPNKRRINTSESRHESLHKGMLKELRQLLALPRSSMIRGGETEVSLRDPKLTRLHRCDSVLLRGRVKKPKSQRGQKRRRVTLSGLWVLAAIKSKVDGQILDGWARLDQRGFFRFYAQVPPDVPPGDYQILVYFPAQAGMSARWSDLEE